MYYINIQTTLDVNGVNHASTYLLPIPRWTWQGTYLYLFKYYLRVLITNSTDPENNWELYTRLNDIGELTGTWTLIKKVGT